LFELDSKQLVSLAGKVVSVPVPQRFDTDPDQYYWITDRDPDSALFYSGFQDAKEYFRIFILLLSVDIEHLSSKITSIQKSQYCGNQGVS
jgi:hypothetical protein